jgi:peroxiredoxin
VLSLYPRRRRTGSKFDSGVVVVAGGSAGLTGAPTMAALSAQRAGAGYVQVAVPEQAQQAVELRLLEQMTRGLPAAGGAHTAAGVGELMEMSERAGAVVLGVSPDSERSHQRFKEKYGLPFTLLADEGHRVAEDYGVWVEKSNRGRTYMGIDRSTFVIGPDGEVKKAMRGVKPDTHADDVLAVLGEA